MVLVAYKLNSAIERGTKPDRFCWSQHICAPYLDEPEAAWFGAGRPVVGYFHDRELAPEGVEWMRRWLDWWQNAGAQRLMDFRELDVHFVNPVPVYFGRDNG